MDTPPAAAGLRLPPNTFPLAPTDDADCEALWPGLSDTGSDALSSDGEGGEPLRNFFVQGGLRYDGDVFELRPPAERTLGARPERVLERTPGLLVTRQAFNRVYSEATYVARPASLRRRPVSSRGAESWASSVGATGVDGETVFPGEEVSQKMDDAAVRGVLKRVVGGSGGGGGEGSEVGSSAGSADWGAKKGGVAGESVRVSCWGVGSGGGEVGMGEENTEPAARGWGRRRRKGLGAKAKPPRMPPWRREGRTVLVPKSQS